MKKIFLLILFISIFLSGTFAQQGTIQGKIINSNTKETIPGVAVMINETTGVVSDIDGNYSIKADPGKVKLTYRFIGFAIIQKTHDLKAGEVLKVPDIALVEEALAIDGIVVSAGKFEQKLSDITISMSVLRPDRIESQNTNNITEALNKIPGMDITESQPSIRGGSGYSYGAGSRVLLLVDDMPILSPDAGDAKWNFVPLENIEQIEVLKGASSALHGSSALNGVINIRTAYPKDRPLTKFSINGGVYGKPKRKELVWWKSDMPSFAGASFFHSRKIKRVDLVIGANVFQNNSFRESEGEARGRVNANFRWRPKKVEGLSLGFNTNFMLFDKTDFFLWQNADSGAYRSNPEAITHDDGYRFNADPFIMYFDKKGNRYSLRTRYYRGTNNFRDEPDKNSIADLYYGEFQYHRSFKEKYHLTTGAVANYHESTAALFGDHYGTNMSVYLQFDARFFKRVSISLGARGEYYRIDTSETVSSYAVMFSKDTIQLPIWPVFRLGMNVQAAKFTFIRISFGQGYRFPTIAEKYIKTSLGGLHLFPNPDLKAETGWSAELGIKQGYKLGNFNGYIDLAGFWTEYSNMMEFTFGIYPQDSGTISLEDVGFKSINVGHAQITGFDLSITGQGKLWGCPISLLCGYTYTNPIDLTYDPSTDSTRSTDSRILKYRYYHSVKGDIEMTLNRFTFGISYIYNSRVINIDNVFGSPLVPGYTPSIILPGLNEYREKHNKGYHVFDLRTSYDITESSKISIIIKNLLNEEYMTRPGWIEAPFNIALQYSLQI